MLTNLVQVYDLDVYHTWVSIRDWTAFSGSPVLGDPQVWVVTQSSYTNTYPYNITLWFLTVPPFKRRDFCIFVQDSITTYAIPYVSVTNLSSSVLIQLSSISFSFKGASCMTLNGLCLACILNFTLYIHMSASIRPSASPVCFQRFP